MNISTVLLDILVVLVAAKLAAELAERVGVPAVVGEIVAGIVIGPSVLGIVGRQRRRAAHARRDRRDPAPARGRPRDGPARARARSVAASLLVATVGVVTPLAARHRRDGADRRRLQDVAVRRRRALTATSVGITARVFGDLRALATTEARIVLGAAVADDVMGLVVLTVVVRLVTEGSVSFCRVAGIVLVAVALPRRGRVRRPAAGATSVRARRARVALDRDDGRARVWRSRSPSRELADAAKLAPIVGAFVAGLALARSEQSERIRRELAPVGHLFIPVFFLQIGIDAEIDAFARVAVLRDAAILLRRRRRRQAAVSRSGRSARRATSCSSASACCPAARSD